MKSWDYPHSAFQDWISQDSLLSTHKQSHWLCWLSPSNEILRPGPNVSQTQQSKLCKREVPSKQTESWPWARRHTWEIAYRGTTQVFPGCVFLTLQLHVQPWAWHSKGYPMPRVKPREETTLRIRIPTIAAKITCFIEPLCFQANNWWAHLRIQWPVASEI